jgi:hypothetical protein
LLGVWKTEPEKTRYFDENQVTEYSADHIIIAAASLRGI